MSSNILHIAASGVRAARAGLDLTAQNIANAETDGYVRRTLNLSELATAPGFNRVGDIALSGVRIAGIGRNADAFRQAEARRTGADAARAGTELAAYRNVESALEQSGLFGAMTGLETALQQLTTDPVDPSLRAAALESAQTVARTFNIARSSLDGVAEALQFSADDGVTQVNRLAGELARVNLHLARTPAGTSDHVALLDQRDGILERVANHAEITTRFAADHTVEVRVGGSGGPLLVSGGQTAPLALAKAADSTISFSVGGSAASLSSGTLAGQAQGLALVRDTRLQLDGLADSLIATANGAQTSGAALDGTPGQPLFSGSGAAGIAVALTSGAQLATAPAGAVAGSRNQAGLAALRGALEGNAIAGQIDAMLFAVSSATQGRQTTTEALDGIAAAARLSLDAQAGVDLDAEAVNLVRYQQAFQASSKAIQIANEMFDTLLQIR